MGDYIDSSFGYNTFELLYNKKFFVDKSNIIQELNKLIQNDKNCICITKPRRFGKTSIAALIIAYYSKSRQEKFKEMFKNLNISNQEGINPKKDKVTNPETDKNTNPGKDNGTNPEKILKKSKISEKNLTFEETQGKYHTIYIDYSENVKKYKEKGLNAYLLSIEKKIINELKDISTEFKSVIDKYSKIESFYLNEYLKYIHIKTGEKFIFVIDEWDYMFLITYIQLKKEMIS